MATHPIGESKHPSVCVGSVLVSLTDRSAIAASGEVEPQLPAHYRVDRRPSIAAQSTVWTNLVRVYAQSREVLDHAVDPVTELAAKADELVDIPPVTLRSCMARSSFGRRRQTMPELSRR
jgi:hypothetical protein